jgi:hypothetical protein
VRGRGRGKERREGRGGREGRRGERGGKEGRRDVDEGGQDEAGVRKERGVVVGVGGGGVVVGVGGCGGQHHYWFVWCFS